MRFSHRASSSTPKTATAATTETTTVQPKSPQPGPAKAGSGNGRSAQAAVLNPENEPRPMKTSEPMPAESSPGRRTTGRVAPPMPIASTISTAPITGEPKIDATAANAPAAAISALA